MKAELVMLGASKLDKGNACWQAQVPVGDETNDTLSFGECSVFQALGITSLPFPANGNGHAEGIAVRGVAGQRAVIVGARDTRSGKVVGKMDPGDTVVHSTDPDETAQVRVQGKKKSASVIVKDADGKHMMVLLDGKNKTAKVLARGACIEIDEGGDISILGKGGGGILIQGNKVAINGELKIPGLPSGMVLMACPLTGPVTIPAVLATPLTLTPGTWMPVLGVSGYT